MLVILDLKYSTMFGFGIGKICDSSGDSAQDPEVLEEDSASQVPPWLKRQRMNSTSCDDSDLIALPNSDSSSSASASKHNQIVQTIW